MPITTRLSPLLTACALACAVTVTAASRPAAASCPPFSGPCGEPQPPPSAELTAGERALVLLMLPTLFYDFVGVPVVASGYGVRYRYPKFAAIGVGLGGASLAAGLYAAREWSRTDSESSPALGYATAVIGGLAFASGVLCLFGEEQHAYPSNTGTFVECNGKACRMSAPAPRLIEGAGGPALGVGLVSGTF